MILSFRHKKDAHELKIITEFIKEAPPVLRDLGPPIKSKDVGKTMAIPNIKNMGVRPIRSSISTQKDSAQHLMYLRIATPFDAPDERPYPIINVGRDHDIEVARVKALRQDPVYKFVS